MSAFHAYDIRGIWNVDFDEDFVYRVGRCLPSLLGTSRVLVGRDARESSPVVFAALARGLADAGADIDDLGLCTTPVTYWFTGEKGYGAAVMITASHNPKECNGLKISRAGALPVGVDSGLRELEAAVGSDLPPKAAVRGTVRTVDWIDEYVAFQKRALPDTTGLRFVVDCSNGVAALLARKIFGSDGVTYLNETIDGTFPAHAPNPLLPETCRQLGEEVVRQKAAFGFIFDGDADRVVFVDSHGRYVRPDIMTAVLADHFLAHRNGLTEREAAGGPRRFLCDIRTSRGVTEAIARLGGEPHLWKVGHAFAKIKIRELDCVAGGELAGHYYFRDFHFCDSAILAAITVLERVCARGDFDEMIAAIDVYANSGECNYSVDRKDEAIEALRTWAATLPPPDRVLDFDGLRYDWPDGWFNVRKSNTEPYLRLLVEAATPAALAARKAEIEAVLAPFVERT